MRQSLIFALFYACLTISGVSLLFLSSNFQEFRYPQYASFGFALFISGMIGLSITAWFQDRINNWGLEK